MGSLIGSSIRYLCIIHLDAKLTWATHINTKRKSLNLGLHELSQLLRSEISRGNEILINEQLIRPAMTYCIRLGETTKTSYLELL